MLKYYTNRDLSRKLDIPISKWKRWSREFLPPDPLGGYQSGFARQYSLREAFLVFLGGHLVAELRFTIPESRQILNDLESWLKQHMVSRTGFPCLKKKGQDPGSDYEIFIRSLSSRTQKAQPDFSYAIREMQSIRARQAGEVRTVDEQYRLSLIHGELPAETARPPAFRVLMISSVTRWFAGRMGQCGPEGDARGEKA